MREISVKTKIAAAIVAIAVIAGCIATAVMNGGKSDEVRDNTEVLEATDDVMVEEAAEEEVAEEAAYSTRIVGVFDELREYGYANLTELYDDMQTKNDEAIGIADEAIGKYTNIISDEQKAGLAEYEDIMSETLSRAEYEEAKAGFDGIVSECDSALAALSRPTYSSNSGGYYLPTDGLTMSGGINYHNGRTETWYSSNVLYHYRTGEWTVDSEGFYRDANGHYVVAASDMAQGTIFEGSKGTCIVLDSGCAAGITDYYVAW